jgi:hypothetical protein
MARNANEPLRQLRDLFAAIAVRTRLQFRLRFPEGSCAQPRYGVKGRRLGAKP